MKKRIRSTKKHSITEQILFLQEQVRILKLENETLQEDRKTQLNVIERLTENQNIRKKAGNG